MNVYAQLDSNIKLDIINKEQAYKYSGDTTWKNRYNNTNCNENSHRNNNIIKTHNNRYS